MVGTRLFGRYRPSSTQDHPLCSLSLRRRECCATRSGPQCGRTRLRQRLLHTCSLHARRLPLSASVCLCLRLLIDRLRSWDARRKPGEARRPARPKVRDAGPLYKGEDKVASRQTQPQSSHMVLVVAQGVTAARCSSVALQRCTDS